MPRYPRLNFNQRMAEYGIYLVKRRDGHYNLGWTHSQSKRPLAVFATREAAQEWFENTISDYWDRHVDSFIEYVEDWSLPPGIGEWKSKHQLTA